MKKALCLLLSALSLPLFAATNAISMLPVVTNTTPNDRLPVSVWTGSNYVSRQIAVSNLVPVSTGGGVPAEWNAVFGNYDIDGNETYAYVAQIGEGTGGTNGAAFGYYAQGYNYGAAFGYYAQGYNYGAAVGYGANGSSEGAAVGHGAYGSFGGAAVGHGANGSDSGAAFGNSASGNVSGAAFGNSANGSGQGNVAIGTGAIANMSYSEAPFENTAEIGTGQATLNGGLHYRGNVICDGDGVVLVKSPSGCFWHLAVTDDGTLYATNAITADGQACSAP